MKINYLVLKPAVVFATTLVWCALNVLADPDPSITLQPASLTNLAGASVTFSVAAGGTGPFTYQWQFNGVNFPNNIISTVAGSGSKAYAGDGGPAINASLNYPNGVALDAGGNLYIADTTNKRIRRVDTNGTIITFAGNNGVGFSGDGGMATNAALQLPYGLALDRSGNLYIADQGNGRIRRVATNGIITTVAGRNLPSSSGDGGAATNANLYAPTGVALDAFGNLFIAEQYNNRIRRVDTNGIITTVAGNGSATYAGDGGAATNASLYFPASVALDGLGNLYIADYTNNRIRRVDTSGIITTVAGGGAGGDGGAATDASLNNPYGVALDQLGNLYVGDQANNRIRRVGSDGFISTVGGNGVGAYAGDGGTPTNASLQAPSGIAFDAAGNLYIADRDNNRIRKVLLSAGYPTFTLGNVGAINAGNYTVIVSSSFGSITSAVATLTVQAPPVITVQPASQTVVVGSDAYLSVAAVGSGSFEYLCYLAGTNLVQSGTNGAFTLPGISTNDAGGYTIVVANSYGSVTSLVATLTVAFPPSLNNQPASLSLFAGTNVNFSVSVNGTGPFNYQWQINGANLPNNLITTVAGNGSSTYGGDGGAATNAGVPFPFGLASDAMGNLYISEQINNRIRRVDTNGIITTVAGGGPGLDGGPATNANLRFPTGVVLDAAGNLYIADRNNSRIRRVDTNGIITTVAGKNMGGYSGDGGAATNAGLAGPTGVALDGLGNLYIADVGNNRIRRVGTNGIIATVAGNGSASSAGDGGAATNASLNGPWNVALDAAGNLYIADYNNSLIRRVGTNGIIATVAGNGSASSAGDGGAATNASMAFPIDVALDWLGNLYIADFNNSRIRRVDTNGIITTVAGNGSGIYAGDGGASTNAGLDPRCMALDAMGNLYIADQGNSRIRRINLAGQPTLALTNVSPNNAGIYTILVTSPYGSVTGTVATLTVNVPTTPPQIIAGDGSFGFQTNHFGFNLGGASGQTIIVDGSADLVIWTPLFTNLVTGSPFYFFDPASSNFTSRYYRARLP